VLVVNDRPQLPPTMRLGESSLLEDLWLAFRTGRSGFPPIPVLLLPQAEGERILSACRRREPAVSAEFRILPDEFPRTSLRRRICQSLGLLLSGVGVLYGIIQCFAVDLGEEFIIAEKAAHEQGAPCICIDVDINGFCRNVFSAVALTPNNLWRSLRAWVALPRIVIQVMFPSRDRVDSLGVVLLHSASCRLRTWIVVLLAGVSAVAAVASMLWFCGGGSTGALSGVGVAPTHGRGEVQGVVMLLIEFYVMPRLYEAVASARDEAMYQRIATEVARRRARRLVVVVGVAHANGILQRVATRGLRPMAEAEVVR